MLCSPSGLEQINSTILFHKYSIKDKIPLKLPTLKIGNKVMRKHHP